MGETRGEPFLGSHFIYAALLPPGHHSFLIYDPELDRAFCKELVIDANSQDFYSDMPNSLIPKRYLAKKTKQDVWRLFEKTDQDLKFKWWNYQKEMIPSTIPMVEEKFHEYLVFF